MISCVSISSLCTITHRRVTLPHRWRLPKASFSSYQSQKDASRVQIYWSATTRRPAAIPFDLSPPPIDLDFPDDAEIVEANVSENWRAETFNNDDEALCAVDSGSVVVNLSHYGRIRVSGEDRLQFLHNQSTANFDVLREGEGCDTVFVTPTARTIDIANAWVMKTAVTLVVSPSTSGSISEMLKKYIFFADEVEIEDVSDKTCLFVLVGPESNQVIKELGLGELIDQPYGSHKHYSVGGNPITVAVGNVISYEGFSLLMAPSTAKLVWKGLVSHGATRWALMHGRHSG